VSVVPALISVMTTTPLDPRIGVLDAARDAVAARMRAEVGLLVAAREWAGLHPATGVTDYAGFGEDLLFGEALTPLAGDGAPLVAEFAPAELAAVLGWSTETVKELMGDALELAHRLPRTWELVTGLRLPVPLARYVAQLTRDLDAEVARRADRMLACGDPGKLTRRMAKRVVDEVRLHQDPDRAVADEQDALAARRVELREGATPATTEVTMSLDTADAEAFDRTVADLAESLKRLGDDDDLDVRRARAVGIMADPQTAATLLPDSTAPAPDAPARPRPREAATLYLHLDLATLAALAVAGRIGGVYDEKRGVATTDLVHTWLTRWLGPDAKITVKPVLDLHHPETLQPVDRHDPTEPMADLVRLRDPCCVFPGCTKPSRACDLDHIQAYLPPDDGGPPGQTHPDNLAPLCRHHHRVKTHARWHYRRLPAGGYRWTTPAGLVIDTSPRRPRL
jgi:hypothetical protein